MINSNQNKIPGKSFDLLGSFNLSSVDISSSVLICDFQHFFFYFNGTGRANRPVTLQNRFINGNSVITKVLLYIIVLLNTSSIVFEYIFNIFFVSIRFYRYLYFLHNLYSISFLISFSISFLIFFIFIIFFIFSFNLCFLFLGLLISFKGQLLTVLSK